MAEDVSRPRPASPDDEPDSSGLLPERRRQPERRPELPGGFETLPELRPEDRGGELDRWRGAPPPSTYAPRFRALTGALVGLAIGGLVAATVALFGRGFEPGPQWSAWKPSQGGTTGADQIAKHVAPAYKLPTGDQMVLVTGGPVRVADLELPVRIAVAGEGAQPIAEVKGKAVQYQLCGLGARCAIDKGTPSVERFLLLRREALELALYSFRYLKGVDNVVAFLPPAPGEMPRNALFFRRPQLKAALQRPLASTLPAPPPTVNSVADSPDAGLVKRFTDRNLFLYSFEQAQDYGALLVLNRRAPTAP